MAITEELEGENKIFTTHRRVAFSTAVYHIFGIDNVAQSYTE